MADRDLTYRISAAVTGVQPVDDLATKLAELETSVTTLDSTDATVDVKAGQSLTDTTSDVDTLTTDVETLDGSTATVDVDASGAADAKTDVQELSDTLRDIPVVGEPLADLAGNLEGLGSAGQSAAGKISGLLQGIGGWTLLGTALSGVSAAMNFFSQRAEAARKKAEELANAQREINEAISEGNFESAATDLIGMYGDLFDQAAKAGVEVKDVTDFITGQTDAVDLAAAGYRELTDEQIGAINQWRQMGTAVGGYTTEQLAAMSAQQQTNEELRDLQSSASDARREVRASNETWQQSDEVVRGVASSLEGLNSTSDETAQSQAEIDAAAKAAAEALEAENDGARALAETMGSADWQAAEVQGATTAFDSYTDALFAAGNQAQQQQSAYEALGAAIGDTGLRLNEASEAGFAQQDALEQLAGVVNSQLVKAYDDANGSFDRFSAGAAAVAAELRGTLMNDLGLTVDEANQVLDAMGLLDDSQVEARFNLAGAEEARIQLGLLSDSITGLPDDVEQEVQLKILAGDYVGARDQMQSFYEDNPNFLEVQAQMEGAENTIEETLDNIPEGTMYVSADTGEAEGEMDAAAAAAPGATIVADADTVAAASDLLDVASMPRGAIIRAEAWTDSAEGQLGSVGGVSRPRTATITANANTASANAEIDYAARDRYSTIHVSTVTRGGYRGLTTGSASPSAAAAPAGLAAFGVGAVASPAVGAPVTGRGGTALLVAPQPRTVNVTVQAAVIGNVYEVQRVVTRAVAAADRLGRRA